MYICTCCMYVKKYHVKALNCNYVNILFITIIISRKLHFKLLLI